MPNRNINDNPIQPHYDDKFNGIKKAEERGNAGGALGTDGKPGIDGVRSAEESPGKNWKNNVVGTALTKSGGFKTFAKKKSPILAIIITLVGGGIGIGGLLGPASLLIQIKETMVNTFDSQLGSMDARTTALLNDKTTSGILCGSVISIACKYSSMSDKTVSNFEEAGITVNSDSNTLILGRTKPSSFEFNGETIEAKDFSSKLASDPEFGAAVKEAYNPKSAGFADNVWTWVETKLGISKAPEPIAGNTDSESLKNIQQDTSTPADTSTGSTAAVNTSEQNPATGANYTQAEADAQNAASTSMENEISNDATAISASGETSAEQALTDAEAKAGASAGAAADSISVMGLTHAACAGYGALQAVGYAAKTVRAVQLARFAMLFLNVADQIKAGVAKPDDVSYLGKVLTTETKSDNGVMKSATDSFGYKYAAYGETDTMSTSASKFLAGGGLTGALIGFSAIIDGVLLGTPKKTCGIVNNPFVVGGSFLAGVAALCTGGFAWAKVAQSLKDAAPIMAIYIGIAFLPALLKDIVAGVLVDKTTVGEAAGDALTSGSSGLMGDAAKAGGNAPLTPAQAVAYKSLSNDIAAKYAKQDQATHSPLDPTNSNTFIGMIVSRLLPYASKLSSLSGALSSVASLTTGSFASILTPSTKATSTSDYTMCQDMDYKAMGLATDPYCNVVYGIPPDALKANPIDVANALVSQGQIDPATGDPVPASTYATFVADCITRTTPLGSMGPRDTESDGSDCKFSENNKNYYLHYIDQRVQAGMDGESTASNTATTTTATGAAPTGATRPDNVQNKGKGWTLKDNTDYSSVACASGSTDTGTYKHPTHNFTIRQCTTALGTVSSLISQKVVDMVNAAKADGVNLSGSSFRSYEEQKRLYSQNCRGGHCSPPTASPGSSQHERGLATDFNSASKGGKVWNWLSANGAKYGYINFPAENWHWSMSGT